MKIEIKPELKTALVDIINQHEKFKNSYFWSPPSNASGRRLYEERYSRDDLSFEIDGRKYEISQKVSCSCKNVYYSFSVYVDDSKKTIRVLKTLVN